MSGELTGPGRTRSLSRRFVLDSFALLALVQDEPGAQMVEDLIIAEDTEIFIGSVNLGEVLYVVQRHFGEQAAVHVEKRIFDTPKVKVVEASWARVKSAASLKAGGGVSYADCFGAALAEEMDAVLVTSDPEFRRLESEGKTRVAWLS